MQYKHDLDLLVKSRKDNNNKRHKSSSLKSSKGQKAKFKSSIQSPVLDPGGATFPGNNDLIILRL